MKKIFAISLLAIIFITGCTDINNQQIQSVVESKNVKNKNLGKILLDVEQNGEAYYINPDDLKGHYLNRPSDAFRIMRELGLGITNDDVRKIDVGEIE